MPSNRRSQPTQGGKYETSSREAPHFILGKQAGGQIEAWAKKIISQRGSITLPFCVIIETIKNQKNEKRTTNRKNENDAKLGNRIQRI